MSKLSQIANVVDEVWSMTSDGRWHSRKALARKSAFKPSTVNAALGFLVKYGFIQSSGGARIRVRVVRGPSPKEVASMLLGVAFDDERRLLYS